jgi:hypothetical protein
MPDTPATPARSAKFSDVVGIEVGASKMRLVRLLRGPVDVEVLAVGELPGVDLPVSASDPITTALTVPKHFAAPHAALVVDHPQSVMRLVALKKPPEEDEVAALSELFGASPPSDFRVGFADVGGEDRSERLYVACGMPDYVAAGVAGLLPEARRPAPASLQLSAVARLNAFALGPAKRHGDAGVVHLQIEENLSTVTVFNAGRLVAQRQFPVGNGAVVAQVAQQFGLSNTLAAELLNENQIDPSNATVPVLTPLFRQVAMSTDFVVRRENCRIAKVFLSGALFGPGHWLRMAETVMGVESEFWMPFDDHPCRPRAVPRELVGRELEFVAALGAALALMEGE